VCNKYFEQIEREREVKKGGREERRERGRQERRKRREEEGRRKSKEGEKGLRGTFGPWCLFVHNLCPNFSVNTWLLCMLEILGELCKDVSAQASPQGLMPGL
jgi:hypothetical protein